MPFTGSSRPPLHSCSAGPGATACHTRLMAPEVCASRSSMCQGGLECDGVPAALPSDSLVSDQAREHAIATRRARKKQPRLDKTRIPCPWDKSQYASTWSCLAPRIRTTQHAENVCPRTCSVCASMGPPQPTGNIHVPCMSETQGHCLSE